MSAEIRRLIEQWDTEAEIVQGQADRLSKDESGYEAQMELLRQLYRVYRNHADALRRLLSSAGGDR